MAGAFTTVNEGSRELERQLAIDRGEYHEGVPAISVVVDCGWCKRSHRHTYNAKSGVGIIIGLATKKILHISVRNKYCSGCATGSPHDEHQCYKNWTESSSAMETSAILEGLYTEFVSDGDSAVYPTLIQEVPWGLAIKKIECANHACKCYRSRVGKACSK